jgi:thiamine biosynthesis lipoprotein
MTMTSGQIEVPIRPGSMLRGLQLAARRALGRAHGAADPAAAAGWYSADEAIMGTAIHAELWCPEHRLAQAAITAVMAEMHRIDAAMSPHKPDSELSRINRDAAQAPVAVSREMFDLVARSIEFSRLSDGAFDITFAAVGQLYDYRRGVAPTQAEVAVARAAVGYQGLTLDARAGTVQFTRPGMRIDLGGFAKGHAVDNCAVILRGLGIENAIVSAGGDSRILGDRRGRPWTVGIRDPRKAGQVVALLPLVDTAVSTSGDYERYFERDGVRFHHVIDPRTGKSPDAIQSVTVLAPDGLTTEALAKCVFVMGLEAGLQLVESRAGADAVVVDASGRLHYSSGLLDRRPSGPAVQ